MSENKTAVNLYILNVTLIITHEIDSAYWHEWKLLNLPGGIDLFLILNFILIAVFIFGLKRIIEWKKHAILFYVLLALSGIFAFTIHSFLIWQGHPEFNTPVSLTILILIGIVSILQLIILTKINRRD